LHPRLGTSVWTVPIQNSPAHTYCSCTTWCNLEQSMYLQLPKDETILPTDCWLLVALHQGMWHFVAHALAVTRTSTARNWIICLWPIFM